MINFPEALGLGCLLDCLANARIGATAADVARHCRVDVRVVGAWCRCQQRRGGHDLPGLAIAALNNFKVQPGFLHLGASCSSTDGFNRRYATFSDRPNRHPAGPHRRAFQMYGARAAQRNAASELRSREGEYVAKDPEQRHVRRNIDAARFAVDIQCDHLEPRSLGRYWIAWPKATLYASNQA